MPSVKVRRKPLWRIDLHVGFKDGTAIDATHQARFSPGEVRDGVEGDPIDEAMEQLFKDPRLETLLDSDGKLNDQLTEFSLVVRRA